MAKPIYRWGAPEQDIPSMYCGACDTFLGLEDEDPQVCPKCGEVVE